MYHRINCASSCLPTRIIVSNNCPHLLNPPNTFGTHCILKNTAYNEYKIYSTSAKIIVFFSLSINPLNPELNPICYLLALLGAHHFLHVSRIRVKLLTFRLLMSYIYGAPILDVFRSHTTTQHSR